jgi:hypothetical protein
MADVFIKRGNLDTKTSMKREYHLKMKTETCGMMPVNVKDCLKNIRS